MSLEATGRLHQAARITIKTRVNKHSLAYLGKHMIRGSTMGVSGTGIKTIFNNRRFINIRE